MATATELKTLAIERLKEAECLFCAEHYYGAFYIGGYAVELALKACTCKTLDIDIFDKTAVPANIARGFMIHNISDLIFLSGLTKQLKAFSSGDDEFSEAWSVVTNWSEQRRYELGCDPMEVGKFIASVKTVMQWLQKIW